LLRKSNMKEVLSRLLLVTMVLTSLLILPLNMPPSSAAPDIGYSVSASPNRIQEGLDTNITLSLNGATANTTYNFKINVTAPSGISFSKSATVETGATGSGSNIQRFWQDFANANTNYVGLYKIAVNGTLATANFTVGLTDKLKYLRSETASIRGSGYMPNESVTVDMKFGNASVLNKTLNASQNGLVTYLWTIPENATSGVYTLTLTNATAPGTIKTPADTEEFTVDNICQIQTRNLAYQTVTGVTVEVYNATSGLYTNLWNKTDETGQVKFVLEAGNYTFKAFWAHGENVVEVGTRNWTLTENTELQLIMRLSALKITVTEEKGAPIPFTDLNLQYNYTTRDNKLLSDSGSFTTSINGTVQLQDAFTNISYLITARRYGFVFNTTFIKSLPAQAWNNITIVVPTYTMVVHVLDAKNSNAVGLRVLAYEWSSGISEPVQSNLTDSSGNVTLSLTFGRYRLRLSKDTTLVNEVTVDLIQNLSSFVVHSDVYNVDLRVFVFDYFGQPIPRVLVELQRKIDSNYQVTENQTTGADGIARFNGIIGGDSCVYVSVLGSSGETQYVYLAGSTTDVVFKMDRYVAVFGYPLETSQLVTIMLLIILIAVFIIASTYKKLPILLHRREK
jgi:5-hydroxyisourate hydrolase-like protein (transthyretin family)